MYTYTETQETGVGSYPKLPVSGRSLFQNDSITGQIPELSGRFLLSRPVNKYEVKVHESVGLQERLSLCTCFSLCSRSLPSSPPFPCPKVTFPMSRKTKSQTNLSECGRLCPRKWGKELPVPIVTHSRWRSRIKQQMPELWRLMNRPLLLSLLQNKLLLQQPPLQSTASAHCQKQATARRQTRTVLVHPPKKHASRRLDLQSCLAQLCMKYLFAWKQVMPVTRAPADHSSNRVHRVGAQIRNVYRNH